MNNFRRILSIAMIGVFLSLPLIPRIQAAPATQGFNASQNLPDGSLVSRQGATVDLANTSNISTLIGVSVSPADYLINIDSNKLVQVVTNGPAQTLVSDINGDVRAGDPLTASPISGVAMKATETTKVLGLAQSGLSDATNTQRETVTDKHGNIKEVQIGRIMVDINVIDYKIEAGQNSGVVSGLQTVASSTIGKQVSPTRAVMAFVVLLLALALSIIVLYSGVSSSIKSIGRNPLSKKFVVQSLIQVIFAVFIIMVAAFAVVYMVIGS